MDHLIRLPQRLDGPGLAALRDALSELDEPRVLAGACEGLALGVDDDSAWGTFVDVLLLLHAGPPTVAAVDGACFGGGVGLVAACDRVLATSESRFGLPEGLWGLVPGAILPALLGRLRPAAVRRLVATGASISAEDARWLGLVDEVDGDPRAALRSLRRVDPWALAEVRHLTQPHFAADVRMGVSAAGRCLDRPTTRERIARWLDGRAPWSDPS